MKTLVLLVISFLILSHPPGSYGQGTEVSSVLSGLMGDSTIDLPERFECNKSLTIQLLTENDDSVEHSAKYILRYPESGSYMIMMPIESSTTRANGNSEVVIDFDQMQMITFLRSGGAKMAVIMPVKASQISDKASLSQKYGQLTKTGKSKIISGHEAEEYAFNSENTEGTLWIAHDFDIGISKSFSALGLKINSGDNPSSGIIVELDAKDKKTAKHTKVSLLRVNFKDDYTINTAGFIPTKLPEAIESE